MSKKLDPVVRLLAALLVKKGDLNSDERYDLIQTLMDSGLKLKDIRELVPNLFDAPTKWYPRYPDWHWYPTYPVQPYTGTPWVPSPTWTTTTCGTDSIGSSSTILLGSVGNNG